jgi:hypothetical protein
MPCAAEVSGGKVGGVSNSIVYHSVALSGTTMNVTPLTDLLLANSIGNASLSTWFSALNGNTVALTALTQTKLDTALANLNAAFPALPLYAAGNNPITSAFSATSGNTHDDMLAALQLAMSSSGVTYSSLLTRAATPQFSPPTALVAALSNAYHNTTSGSAAVYFPVDSAFSTLESSAMTISMTGTYKGNTFSLTQINTPLSGIQNFGGQSALALSTSGTINFLGNATQVPASTLYYSIAPYKNLGGIGTNSYTVYSKQIPLPIIATLGSSGTLDSGTDYTDATKSSVVDTFEEKWSLQAGTTSGTANLCINVTIAQPSGTTGTTATQSTCVTIDTTGKILQLQLFGPVDGTLLTLTSTSITTPPPTVISAVPANGSIGVVVSSPVSLTFSEPVDPTTFTSSTFTLYSGVTPVSGTVSVSGAIATFTPSIPLATNTSYTATVSGNVRDLSGNTLGSNYSWTFQTKSLVAVVATSPTPYSYPFALSGVVTATFSSAVDPSTVNSGNFTLSGPSGLISGTVGYSGVTATFTPTTPLTVNTVYRASISSSIKDLAGDPLAAGRTWTFQTFAPGTATTPQPFSPIPVGLWQPALGATPSSGNFVYLQSDSGDYIGGGQTYTYTPLNAQLTFSATTGGATVQVSGNDLWNGYFNGPSTMGQLQVGYYSGLVRYPFHSPVLGGLSWSGKGRGCNTLLGWFAVDNVAYNNGALSALDLRFEQQCEGGQTALHGSLHMGP